MASTIYASFADPAQGERAAGALLDYGVRADDLSIVTHGEVPTRSYGESPTDAQPISPEIVDPALTGWRGGSIRGQVADREGDATAYDEVDDHDIEGAAKSGISTTTPADAGAGAAKGAGIGLGVGILAGLASLAVPGVGLVVGGGALASAIGLAAGTTAAGAVAGGVTGYLKDQGVDEHTASRLNETVNGGGTVLAVTVPSNNVDASQAQSILQKYGASNVSFL